MTNSQNCEDCGTFGPVVVLGSGRFSFKVCESCRLNIARNVAAQEREDILDALRSWTRSLRAALCYSCDFDGAPTGGLTAYRPSFPSSADYTPSDHPEVVSLCNPCAAYCRSIGMTLEEA